MNSNNLYVQNPCVSVFIRVQKKFRVLSSEFGVNSDKALFLILGNFRHFRHFEF